MAIELAKADYVPVEYESPLITRVFDWDLVKDATTTADTYELIQVPEGEMLVAGFAAAVVLPVGGTSFRFQWTATGPSTSGFFTGVMATATQTIGTVIPFRSLTAISDTGALSFDWYHDGTVVTDLTLDAVTVGTFTAGQYKIVLQTVNLANALRSS